MKEFKNKEYLKVACYFVFMFFMSCGTQKKYPIIENYSMFKKDTFNEYKLLSYSNFNDSILIVIKKDKLKECKSLSINKINLSNFKRTSTLSKNVGFYYNDSILTNNRGFKIKAGAFKPGEKGKTLIYSYNGMPYLIENCDGIK